MKRKEFIDTLGTLLKEEMPEDIVEENVRYYDDYIRQQGDEKQQEEEIQRIGHPNLIAQTIIESYKMSTAYKYNRQSGTSSYQESNMESDKSNSEEKTGTGVMDKIKRVCITVGIVAILIMLIRFAFTLFIRVGLPLIAIYLIVRLIKGMLGSN